MSELIIERATAPLEAVGDGWTVDGLVVPYEREAEVSDDGGATTYVETFASRSFARDVAKGGRWVNLMIGHKGDDGERYLGRCIGLGEQSDGLHASFRLDRSNPQAEAARAGELTGWSVSARVYRTVSTLRNGRRVLVREVAGISHVAATPRPQYAGAGVTLAREHELIVAPSGTPRLDALREYLDGLRDRA
jgi:HK97 family phage prohead protease